MPTPHTAEWYATVQEDALEPERQIADPHHHLWEDASRWGRYVPPCNRRIRPSAD